MQSDEVFQLPPEFRQQPLSARVLDDFAVCPRKFLLSYFVSRDDERHFRGGPAALHAAARQALVECYGQGGPQAWPEQALLDSFEAHWQGDLCTDSMEEEQLHAQGLQMLRDYHVDHASDAVEVIATDQRLENSLEGQAFVAVADVVLRSDETRVIRFVTSRRPLGETELAEDLSAQLLWLLARERYGSTGVRVLFYALRRRSAREVVLDPEREAFVRRDLAARAARLVRESEFAPVKSEACRWCRVRRRCPLWQR